MKEKKKILFLTNIISPYMHDFFENLAKFEEIDFTVAACAKNEPDRAWSLDYLNNAAYKYKILKDSRLVKYPFKNRFFYLGGLSLLEELSRNNYSAVVFKGGTRFIGPFCALTSRILGKKNVLWEECNLSCTNWLKNIVKPLYINKFFFSSFIAYGTKVREYLETISSDISDKIHFAYSPVDNNKYRQRYLKLKNKKALIKKALGIPPKNKVLLYIGRFVEEKNLFTLIDGVDKLRQKKKNFTCLMVGGGNLDEQLRNYLNEKGLEDYVRLFPFQQFKKLTYYYAAADVFILPSVYEVWGLVVNEAMNFNLPVIVSDLVGCGEDLVRNNYNGFIFPHNTPEKLAECALKAFNKSEAMGRNSYRIIRDKDFDQVCKTIIAAS